MDPRISVVRFRPIYSLCSHNQPQAESHDKPGGSATGRVRGDTLLTTIDTAELDMRGVSGWIGAKRQTQTWVRCRVGWVPEHDGAGFRILQLVDDKENLLPTPGAGRELKRRGAHVDGVVEDLARAERDAARRHVWVTRGAAEQCITFLSDQGDTGMRVGLDLGRTVTLYHRSSFLYQIR